MSKRIAFYADGTWDSAQNQTNVYKLYKATTITSEQVPFYDDGVGSDGTPLEKIAGGAMGDGLFQKIRDGYTKIAHVYEQDDEIYIFGFSRGAYTARSLAGMIAICGLPTGDFDDQLVNAAFQAYRDASKRADLAKNYELYDAQIEMVGVWDTVGSLGIPALFGKVDPILCGFLDTSLHPDVWNAYQALAIDERRQEFPPTLWTPPSPPVDGHVLEQVWFCGVHCDVGGGYPETGLSDITLGWMMGKATNLGLQFDPTVAAQYASPAANSALSQLHDSWSVLWLFPKSRTVADNSVLANSVSIRCAQDNSYKPGNLVASAGVLAGSYQSEPVVQPS